MGIPQPVVLQYADALPMIGSRYGGGHRPSRPYTNSAPVAQIDSVTFAHDNATTYTVTIDGTAFVIAAPAGADATAIANNFIALINAHPVISQVVRAYLHAAGVMRLRARNAGTAFSATTAVAGGAGTATQAAVTANSAGEALNAGDPAFRAAGTTSARSCRLPAAATDIFLGVVPLEQVGALLQALPTENGYPAGSLVPVDPNGMHVVYTEEAVTPGLPVRVNIATNRFRTTDTASVAQVMRVQATAATNTKIYSFIIEDVDGSTYLIEYLSDGSATVTEIRDGLGDRINFLAIPFTSADQSTDAIDITADVPGNAFSITEVDSELTVTTQTANAPGTILLSSATWESVAAAGNKALMAHTVP